MSSTKEYLAFITEQLSGLDDITSLAMMGEYVLYYRGKVFGGIYDDRFLIKPVPAALKLMPYAAMELPYEGGKEMILVEEVDDREFLCKLVRAMYEELPDPKKKKKSAKSKERKADKMIKVYCYPKCTTCKKALKWLDDNKTEYQLIDIKEDHPDEKTLREYHKKSGLPLRRFFNTSGMLYRELELAKKLPEMSEDEMFALLASDGMLVKRPLLVTENTVLTGFKEAEWKEALKTE